MLRAGKGKSQNADTLVTAAQMLYIAFSKVYDSENRTSAGPLSVL